MKTMELTRQTIPQIHRRSRSSASTSCHPAGKGMGAICDFAVGRYRSNFARFVARHHAGRLGYFLHQQSRNRHGHDHRSWRNLSPKSSTFP